MEKEGDKKKRGVSAPKQRENMSLWEAMTLTRVGNLDVIQDKSGSFFDSGSMIGSMMDNPSDLALKREVRSLSGALERLAAIRTA